MAAKRFQIADFVEAMGVPTVGTGVERIEYLPLDLIDPDPDNFYSLDGIEELAANIETVGLQQPLRVRHTQSDGERYTVTSGHRRRAACLLIRDGGSEMFHQGVPCIVERGDVSAEMQELRLIFANSSTRVLTGAEISKQAERVENLLYELEKQGVKFPGRMRDHVAAAVNTSKSRIGRLHAIREHLDKPLLKLFDDGQMNETVAYALAQRPAEMQRQICDAWILPGRRLERMPANFISEYAETSQKLTERKCKLNKGGLCINKDRIMEKICDGTYGYKPCKYGHCCADCDQYLQCRSRCPFLDEKAKAERARRREASKDQKAAERSQKKADIRAVEQVWARYGQALRNADLTDKQLRDSLKSGERYHNEYDIYLGKDRLKALLDFSCPDVKPNEALPYHCSFKVDDYQRLCRFADALGCSLDYLFCRTETPQPVSAPTRQTVSVRLLGWLTCQAPSGVRCWARFIGEETEDFTMMATYDADADSWYCGDSLSKLSVIDQKCIGWWPLPGDDAPDLPGDLTPKPVPSVDAVPKWRPGTPERACKCYLHVDMGGDMHNVVGEWTGDHWRAFNAKLNDEFKVTGWWPLPEDGQENE